MSPRSNGRCGRVFWMLVTVVVARVLATYGDAPLMYLKPPTPPEDYVEEEEYWVDEDEDYWPELYNHLQPPTTPDDPPTITTTTTEAVTTETATTPADPLPVVECKPAPSEGKLTLEQNEAIAIFGTFANILSVIGYFNDVFQGIYNTIYPDTTLAAINSKLDILTAALPQQGRSFTEVPYNDL